MLRRTELTPLLRELAVSFVKGLKEGYTVGVYSSLSWWNSYLTEIKEYIRWVAHWNPTCGYTGDYLIWQYGTEYIDGINGEVDANYYYGDFGKTDIAIKPIPAKPDVIYQVFTDKSGWLPIVKNLEDYAGVDGQPIKGLRVFAYDVQLDITTHQMSNGNIDKLTITSQDHTIKYRVRTIGSKNYLSWMENKKDTGGSSDTFAGEPGKSIDRVQITI